MIEQQFSIHLLCNKPNPAPIIWHVTLDSLYQVWCWETRMVEHLTCNPMEFKDPQLPLLIINFNFFSSNKFFKPRWLLNLWNFRSGWFLRMKYRHYWWLLVWIVVRHNSREQFWKTKMVSYDLFLIPMRMYFPWFFEFSLLFCK